MEDASRRMFLKSAAAAAPAIAVTAATAVAADTPMPNIISPRVIAPGQFFSQAVVFGGVAHIAGVMGTKPGTRELVSRDFEPQARSALENLKASVEAAGSKLDRVVKCNCYLAEAADFATFNRVYATFFPHDPPARSTVIVKALVLEGGKLEIDCIAAV